MENIKLTTDLKGNTKKELIIIAKEMGIDINPKAKKDNIRKTINNFMWNEIAKICNQQ